MTLQMIGAVLEVVAYACAIPGIVISVITYVDNAKSQRIAEKRTVFTSIDLQYSAFNSLLLRNQDLLGAIFLPGADPLSPEQAIRRSILFENGTSLLERAFLFFLDATPEQRADQWPGWEDYMSVFTRLPAYRDWWAGDHRAPDGWGKQFSASFFAAMEAKIAMHGASPTRSESLARSL